MAPESLCFHEGRLESSSGSWTGKRVIYSCYTGSPRAPAPVPGTCHQAFCSDRAGTHWSWQVGPSSGPAGTIERLGPPLLPWGPAPLSCWRKDFPDRCRAVPGPMADAMGETGEGGRHCF